MSKASLFRNRRSRSGRSDVP